MRRFSGQKAIFRDLGKLVAVAARFARQVETAVGFDFLEQRTHAVAVAIQQIEDEALEVGCLGNIHRRTAGVIRLGRLAHPVHAGAEKFVQHIVLVGGGDQLVDRQTHHARNVAGADVAEIAGRHGKRYLLRILGRRQQIAAEVIHHLRHYAGPVDRIDGADLLARLEFQIVGNRLDHILTIVEHALNGDIEDVRVLQAEHLRALERAHFLVRRQHEDTDAFLAAHRVFGRAASVAGSRAENIQFGIILGQRVFEQVAQQLHRHILEGQRRAVRQRLQHQRPGAATAELFVQQMQRRDLAGIVARTRIAIDRGSVGLARDGLQIGCRNVGGEFFQDLERQIGVRQLAPGSQFFACNLRIFVWQIQAAIRRQAAQ